MTETLQKFDWKSSQYQQPYHDWVGDPECSSQRCQTCPGSDGSCRAQNSCVPKKIGDRYQCTRMKADGGPCTPGPSPDGICQQVEVACQPKRSMQYKRRMTTIIFSSLTLSFCLCLFGESSPSPLMSPGHVADAHAFIKNDCAKCHSAAESNFSEWASHVFSSKIGSTDSQRCMKCHPKQGSHPLQPHGLPTAQLAAITQKVHDSPHLEQKPALLGLAAMMPLEKEHTSLACATCHQEHHGRAFNLEVLSDNQCQSCHAKQFKSFEHGHPPLANYPYKRRTRIYFDHSQHFLKHFSNNEFKRLMPAGIAPTSCNSCHQEDPASRTMITRGFEKMCASCHERQIVDQEFPGIPFFAVPEFSPELVIKNEDPTTTVLIGEWPTSRSESGESSLPSLMEMLLADDLQYQEAIHVLGNSPSRHLNRASQAHPRAVEKYLWSIKSLIYDVVQNGEAELKKRLGLEYQSLASMNPSVVQSFVTVQQQWFPNLHSEMEAWREGLPIKQQEPLTLSHEKPGLSMAEHTSGGGWYLREADLSVRYRPISHTDELLQAWMEQSVSFATETVDANDLKANALKRIFRLLENPSASGNATTKGPISSGRCFQCHSVDRDSSNGSLKINWLGFRPNSNEGRLTKFSHAPHTNNSDAKTCTTCHQFSVKSPASKTLFRSEFFKRASPTSDWSLNTNPHSSLTSGFLPMQKSKCAECHNAQTAQQSCVKCHDYHTHSLRGVIE